MVTESPTAPEAQDYDAVEAVLEESLPADWYLSPEIFEVEKERIFYSQWFCVGRTESLQEPGDYLLSEVAGESILIVCDEDRGYRGFYNVCRHRGCQIALPQALPRAESETAPAAAASGRFHNAIRCPYHSWVYGFDGRLKGAPFLRETEGFRKSDLSLHPIDVDTWGGFVFVNLSPETAGPLRESLGGTMDLFDKFPLADLRTVRTLSYKLACNWKVVMENYNECYHCAGVHPELCKVVPAFKQQGGSNLDWSSGIPQREGTNTYTLSGVSRHEKFPGLSDDVMSRHWGKLSYPNMMTSISSDHVAAFTLWPMGPSETVVTCDFLFHPLEITKPDFDPSDVIEFWDLVNRQDWVICEGVQRGMASRSYAHGYYAPMEDPSLDIRRYVTRLLGDAPGGAPGGQAS